MIRDLLVNEDIAYEACDEFWAAIGGAPLSAKVQLASTEAAIGDSFNHVYQQPLQ